MDSVYTVRINLKINDEPKVQKESGPWEEYARMAREAKSGVAPLSLAQMRKPRAFQIPKKGGK